MRQTTAEVIVVGAGVAGLGCALQLGRAGLRVLVLEARHRVGGRVHTLHPEHALLPVELGAEFVHGTPPELFALLDVAGITPAPVLQARWRSSPEGLRPASWYEDGLEDVFADLDEQRAPDRTVDDYLREWVSRHPGRAAAAQRAREYVGGFHAADPMRMGERALAHESAAVEAEGADAQSYRLPAGYDAVVQQLRASLAERVTVQLGAPVLAVKWTPRRVTVHARDAGQEETTATASACVLTLPVGVLHATPGDPGAVSLTPEPSGKRDALAHLVMGDARRVVLHFRDRFWEDERLRAPDVDASLADLGFLQSPEAAVGVWWTAAPVRVPVLTGWLGGPRATDLAGRDDDAVIEIALGALAAALGVTRDRIAAQLVRTATYDWHTDPYARGAYSYATLDGTAARRALAEPTGGTLFWAGEATHWTGSAGTVHGALASGYRAAGEVLAAAERANNIPG